MHFVGISVADIRKEPKFESERDSQLIFGEKIEILGDSGDYVKVRGPDSLEGFMKKAIISEGGAKTHKLVRRFRSRGLVFPFGSYVNAKDVEYFKIPKSFVVPAGNNDYDVCDLSRKFMGIPYLWGGTSDFGFDCSGLVQRLYRFTGTELPRNADWQRDSMPEVKSFDVAKRGDLVFFEGHVGMLLNRRKMIHANGKYASITITDLMDGSEYSEYLLSIFEKIGRVRE